jgi:hypothetical protein
MSVPATGTAIVFSFMAAGMGGLSLGALKDEAVNGTRTVAYTGLVRAATRSFRLAQPPRPGPAAVCCPGCCTAWSDAHIPP